MRKLVQDHDLPQAVFNISLAAHDHKPYEVDCYFPTHRRGPHQSDPRQRL